MDLHNCDTVAAYSIGASEKVCFFKHESAKIPHVLFTIGDKNTVKRKLLETEVHHYLIKSVTVFHNNCIVRMLHCLAITVSCF